ncbi:methylisocitrate lyase [Geomonas sp. Red32]|uniref:methylisocitrate lyase n=1 Tax=Geomonas sp. Red32 TaxID=2912856 RepID=UPI00202D00B4|nr:methylisocitrate lyase [Geomonas sp. Red32]MCM0081119.1 methylisocitrate lyase [Geomonas sp. Red32]
MPETTVTAGKRLRAAIEAERLLPIVGTVNAYCAMLARAAGHRALYLSGAGVANASYGYPDLGITCLDDVLEDARRITGACDLPLLVDIDTGWGSPFTIGRAVREMTRAGAAAVHIEDQVAPKRCGHRANKSLVTAAVMADRVKAAVDARPDASFVIMARTDALAGEGIEAAIERACRYVEAGADAIFAEAVTDLPQYRRIANAVKVPLLANITEFGRTPLFTAEELAGAGVRMALYPLTAFRAMSKVAELVYETILHAGTQRDLLGMMQSREDLYRILNYREYEERLDRLGKEGGNDEQ